MVDATHTSFKADDRSYFSLIKKDIHNQTSEAGYSSKKIAEIDIIVSEMTSNLSKYAVGGEILFRSQTVEEEYVEIICIDNGPGILDVSKVMADGMSTANTLGHGLGSISRFSDKFDIYSQKGWGTIALSRVYKKDIELIVKPQVELKALVVAKPGETSSGDGTFYISNEDFVKVLVADGLGHGIEANKAVNAAVETFKSCKSNDPVEIIRQIHADIKKTRGFVGMLLVYERKFKTWRAVGVGNISMRMQNYVGSKNCISYNGIIGHNIPNTMKIQEFANDDFNQLILCSDGIVSRWDLSKFPAIQKHDLAIQAAAIYKEFGRKTDDMSVIIIKSS